MVRSPEPSIVANPDALVEPFEHPILRDTQIAEIQACLSGKLADIRPIHGFVHGPPGTGKTFCVRFLLERLAPDLAVLPLDVNCRERFTFLAVIGRILDLLKPLRSPQRSRQLEVTVLREALGDRRAVVALDEIDVLTQQDAANLLYHLCGLPKISVICIAATRQPLLNLPEAVRSRFAPRQILFPRYRPEELARILDVAVQPGLKPGSWTMEALERIVRESYGDARRSLALLRHAVERAQDVGAGVLLAGHLKKGNYDYARPNMNDQLGQLSSHHRILYDLVAARGTISGPDLEAAYRRSCRRQNLEPVAPRTLVKYLGTLCQRRILEREHGARTAGWVYRVAGPRKPCG